MYYLFLQWRDKLSQPVHPVFLLLLCFLKTDKSRQWCHRRGAHTNKPPILKILDEWGTAAYQHGNTGSRMITEVTRRWARLIIRLGDCSSVVWVLLSTRGHIAGGLGRNHKRPGVKDVEPVIRNTTDLRWSQNSWGIGKKTETELHKKVFLWPFRRLDKV